VRVAEKSKGLKIEALMVVSGGGVLRKGRESPLHQQEVWGSAVSSPAGSGADSGRPTIF